MAYHLKYRPNEFHEVVGNEEIVESLQEKIKDENRPHTYLFYGETGCGKTTFARIMLTKLGCNLQYVREINCSNENGIETARQIIDEIKMKPLKFAGKITGIILDEVHMTSKNFQNALLKPLEDTPDWVYFFLCTTNPEKLIAPIKSRCSPFMVTAPSNRDMIRFMKDLLKKENKDISMKVLKEISKNFNNRVRECLTALESIVDIKDEESQLKSIHNISSDEVEIIELCRSLIQGKAWNVICDILQKISGDPESIRRAVLGYMSSVLLKEDNPRSALIIECFSDNYYDTGKAGLVKSCYDIYCEE